jgi:Holliday junction resolvase RusA-like endonuclease
VEGSKTPERALHTEDEEESERATLHKATQNRSDPLKTVAELFIPVEPKPQGRVRFATRDGAGKALEHPRKYHDKDTENIRKLLADYALEYRQNVMGGKYFEGPVRFTMVIFRLKPKSYPKKAWAWDKTPDTDNFAKLKDSFNGLIWRDDAQVVEEHIFKVQGNAGQGFYILVQEAEQSLALDALLQNIIHHGVEIGSHQFQ